MSVTTRRSHRGNIRILPLLALLVTFGSGALIYRHFFHRSGEAATELIPSDAMAVATLDLNPQPDQVPLFTQITKAMVEEQIASPVKKAAASSTNGSSFYDEIQPQLQTSYAAAAWKKPAVQGTPNSLDDADYVLLATVKEPSQVAVIAAKHGDKVEQNGLTYYRIRNEKFCVSVIRGYLIVADSPATLMRIQSVDQGKTPSISSLATYQEARGRLPSDANLMLFGHMTELTKAMQSTLTTQQRSFWSSKVGEWYVLAVTLRDHGIETVFKQPYDANDPSAKLVSQIAPIDPGLYRRLPANAYGLLVFAQPGRYYQVIDSALKPGADERKGFEDGINAFEKQTGMSVPRDVLPGLSGNLVLAVYPAPVGTSIPDGLIVLDDANGADPVTLVEKVKAFIVKSSEESHSPAPKFKSIVRDGATIWTLDDETQKSLRSAAGLPDDSQSNSTNATFNGVNVHGNGTDVNINPGSVSVHSGDTNVDVHGNEVNVQGGGTSVHVGSDGVQIGPSTQSKPTVVKKRDDKQLIFATVGKTVLIASSEAMLDRAIAAYNAGKDTLASDPGYTPMLQQIPKGTQNLLLVDMPGVMEALRPLLKSLSHNPNGLKQDDVVGYFGARGNGLVGTTGCDGKYMFGTLFFPLDYVKVIHSVGAASRAANTNSGSGSIPTGSTL